MPKLQDNRRCDNPCHGEKKTDRRKDNSENAESGTVQPSLLLRINLLLLLRLKSPCKLSILCIASTILVILLACLPGLLPLLRLLHLHSLPPSSGAPQRFSFCCFSSYHLRFF